MACAQNGGDSEKGSPPEKNGIINLIGAFVIALNNGRLYNRRKLKRDLWAIFIAFAGGLILMAFLGFSTPCDGYEGIDPNEIAQDFCVDIAGSNLRVAAKQLMDNPNLSREDHRDTIITRQALLHVRGYYIGAIDGMFGPMMEEAEKQHLGNDQGKINWRSITAVMNFIDRICKEVE